MFGEALFSLHLVDDRLRSAGSGVAELGDRKVAIGEGHYLRQVCDAEDLRGVG